MVEESGIFRYNNSVGGGTSAFDQCDSGDFSESDISFADAVSVGIISDPDAGICGQICVGGRETDIGIQWVALLAAGILVFNYGVSDNIGYSNLEKKYEKTYAYCVRLLDRIEQTEGYYQGIPIALVGVIGYDEFPTTDITGKVTDGMIGLSGDI